MGLVNEPATIWGAGSETTPATAWTTVTDSVSTTWEDVVGNVGEPNFIVDTAGVYIVDESGVYLVDLGTEFAGVLPATAWSGNDGV